jgi:site-specific recombinase XerD
MPPNSNNDVATLPSGVAEYFVHSVPRIISADGLSAVRRFVEFFTAEIRNKNTRAAYAQAVSQFLSWAEARHFKLEALEPITISAYIEELCQTKDNSSVKQNLAAIRKCFDYLVLGQILPSNPATIVRGPKHIVRKGKTPIMSAEDVQALLNGIDVATEVGLRDRALIAVMYYTFGRVSAVVGMMRQDFYRSGNHFCFRLHEKGGHLHSVPAHHIARQHVQEYMRAVGGSPKSPLFRTAFKKSGRLTLRAMTRNDAFRMIKRRIKAGKFDAGICCHSFRGSGLTAFRKNGGTLQQAQKIANHASSRTTELYDRTEDEVTLKQIERI